MIATNTDTDDYRRKQRVTLVGAAINLPLALLKILVGWLGHSAALLADGIDSLADLAGDVVVLAAVRLGAKSADHDHPYGHARIETAAMILVSLFMTLSVVWIAWHAIQGLVGPPTGAPSVWALVVAALVLALKEGMYRYARRVADDTRSALIAANAWHYRSDAASSLTALVAIAGSLAGWLWLDEAGALVICLLIAWMAGRYAWQSLRELVDTGLSPHRIAAVRAEIVRTPGVRRMRRLRTRTMGGHAAFADVGVLVDPYVSLTEAHRISEAISARLVEQIDEIHDICVHIEPDGHADAPAAFDLPLRDELLARLRAAWADLPVADHVERVTLHYLNDAVDVELLLPLEQAQVAGSAAALRSRFAAVAASLEGVRSIRPLFR
ncbi:MAG: cation diffusion facilitator family transporter [Salinisphaera sp.]|nr:cation diffusion facilitator family transporter [Salinisphaera sp.]